MATDRSGHVFAAWMNNYHVMFARSDDFGKTWSQPADLDDALSFSDKPTLAVAHSGRDVYVVYNGPSLGDPYVVYSHDGGRRWSSPKRITRSNLYYFSGGSTVLPDGTVLAAQDVYHQNSKGRILMTVPRSVDGGRHWTNKVVGRSREAPVCPKWAGCPRSAAFLGEQATVTSDAAGVAYFLYGSSIRRGGPARLLMRSSDDGGLTWSGARNVGSGPASADHEFPTIAATGTGDVRIAWMDDRTGHWNTFYRRSVNQGRTWGETQRLSNRARGAPYKRASGFLFPYGDYGQIAIDGRGRTLATWGEGPSYIGPGGTWFARERTAHRL